MFSFRERFAIVVQFFTKYAKIRTIVFAEVNLHGLEMTFA